MIDSKDYARTWLFLKTAKWKETFAFLPHQCRISKRWIWLKKAYKGIATYTLGKVPVIETCWHESGEHIKWLLTRDTNETIPSLMAQDIIGVQPMTLPTGNIIKMKYKK